MLIGVGVSCHFSYSFVSYIYVSCSGSITSIGEFFCYHLLVIMLFLFGGVTLSLDAWERLCYLIVAPHVPSI